MLKHLILAISVSLLAVACGGGQAEPATAADAPKDPAAADGAAKPEEKPADAPATPPAADAAKPTDAAAPK